LEKIKLGSLHFDGSPVAVGSKYETQGLSFGDTASANPITWIKSSNGLLVADHAVCVNISWEQLNEQGFIFGRPIKIDGLPYLCRSLKVGVEVGVPNEWDALLDEVGEEDATWHWKNIFSWGQEPVTARAEYHALRGYHSARNCDYHSASYRNPDLGFRPVLEPLGPEPLVSDALIGSKLQIWGTTGSVSGILDDFTDYDLCIRKDNQILEDFDRNISPSIWYSFQPDVWYSFQPDGRLFIDRTAIIYFSLT